MQPGTDTRSPSSEVALAITVPGEMTEIRPGRKLHLAVAPGGGRADTTIFLCHGAGGSKNQWRAQWDALTAAGYRVVAWDYPGHGQGVRSRRREDFAGSAFVDDYLALFDRYKGKRNILAGHSYGTRISLAVMAALAAQGRLSQVESAFLIGAPPPIRTLGLGPIATWPVWLLALMRPKLDAAFVKAAWSPATDPALIRFENGLVQSNTLFMMKSLMTQSDILDADRLGELKLPMLLIAGADDQITPPAAGEALASALPDAVIHTFENCGHQIMLEQAARTTAALMGLVESGAR